MYNKYNPKNQHNLSTRHRKNSWKLTMGSVAIDLVTEKYAVFGNILYMVLVSKGLTEGSWIK